jgi:hypothetical protein
MRQSPNTHAYPSSEGGKEEEDKAETQSSADEDEDDARLVLDRAQLLIADLTERKVSLELQYRQERRTSQDDCAHEEVAQFNIQAEQEIANCERLNAALTTVAGRGEPLVAAEAHEKMRQLTNTPWNHTKHRSDTLAELTTTLQLLEELQPADDSGRGLLRKVNPVCELPTKLPFYMTVQETCEIEELAPDAFTPPQLIAHSLYRQFGCPVVLPSCQGFPTVVGVKLLVLPGSMLSIFASLSLVAIHRP